MCIICDKEYNDNTEFIECCEDVKKIPKELINLRTLYCDETQIKKIPKELINLETLYCDETQIKFIPKELINLKRLICDDTQIKFIPETIKNLIRLICDVNVLVSPQTYKIEPNNKYYLTFVRCQAIYKYKLRLRKLKFAYDPKYIIGHTTKKQLAKLFKK
jgi:Leucine-rich repeat (LRR) protein